MVDFDAYVDVRFHQHKLLMLVLVLALVLASLVKTRLWALTEILSEFKGLIFVSFYSYKPDSNYSSKRS